MNPKPQKISAESAAQKLDDLKPPLARDVNFERPEFQEEVLLIDGDLRVEKENFSTLAESLFVTGNLFVDGMFGDCVDQDVTLSVVLGDVQASNMMVCGQMFVGGSVDVRELIYLNSLNNHSFRVYGDLKAKALVEEGMSTWIGGKVETDRILSLQNFIKQGPEKTLVVERYSGDPQEVFLPEFLEENYGDFCPMMAKIGRAQQAGKRVLL